MTVAATTRIWLHGLVAAAVGAVGTALSTTFAAPDQFNFTSRSGLQHLSIVCLVSSIGAVGAYLKTSPLPPSVTATETTKQSPDGTTTTKSAVKIE